MKKVTCASSIWMHSFCSLGEIHLKELKNWLGEREITCLEKINNSCEAAIIFLEEASCTEENKTILSEIRHKVPLLFLIDTGSLHIPLYKARELLGMGIKDIFSWKEKRNLIQRIIGSLSRESKIRKILQSEQVRKRLAGESKCWEKVLRQIIEVACFSHKPLLITGETGTGKELVSRLIHDLDPRNSKEDLVLLDCSSLVPELSGSEFFGHEKGAYTHAVSKRDGAFCLADQGSLFLDEIGELYPSLQASLLRVIQEGSYKRLGSNQWQKTNFRLISATNRNLLQECKEGKFRKDLFYRLSTHVIHLPALKERRTDIPTLVQFFLKQELGRSKGPELDRLLYQYLMMRDYPGNIRELRQLCSQIAMRYTGGDKLGLGCLPESELVQLEAAPGCWQKKSLEDSIRNALESGATLKEIKRVTGDISIRLAVESSGGKVQDAARTLGVSERLIQGWKKDKEKSKG